MDQWRESSRSASVNSEGSTCAPEAGALSFISSGRDAPTIAEVTFRCRRTHARHTLKELWLTGLGVPEGSGAARLCPVSALGSAVTPGVSPHGTVDRNAALTPRAS